MEDTRKPARKPRSTAPDRPAAKKKPAAARKPGAARTASAAPRPAVPQPPPLAREERVRTAAYFRAERRGFAPGYEWEDWLAAEAEVGALAGSADRSVPQPRKAPARKPRAR